MREVCQTFRLTEQQVKDFYRFARITSSQDIHDNYDIGPCSSSGKLDIDGVTFSWRIRAAGTAEFHNKDGFFEMVCEKQCCDIVENIC